MFIPLLGFTDTDCTGQTNYFCWKTPVRPCKGNNKKSWCFWTFVYPNSVMNRFHPKARSPKRKNFSQSCKLCENNNRGVTVRSETHQQRGKSWFRIMICMNTKFVFVILFNTDFCHPRGSKDQLGPDDAGERFMSHWSIITPVGTCNFRVRCSKCLSVNLLPLPLFLVLFFTWWSWVNCCCCCWVQRFKGTAPRFQRYDFAEITQFWKNFARTYRFHRLRGW